MTKILDRKILFTLFASSAVLCVLSFGAFAQCGVYLKRAATHAFPYPNIVLDQAADMTGDGLPDLLATQEQGVFERSRLFIIPNTGGGTFGSPIIINPPGAAPFHYQYRVVNLNNDVHNDLLMMFGAGTPGSFLVYMNNGNGTFTPLTVTSLSQMGRPTSFFDVDGDGFNDYLGFLSGPTDFKYSLGNGDGTFDPPVTIFNSHGAPMPADFNGDGRTDLIDLSHLHLNNGNSTFGSIDIGSLFNFNEVIWGVADFNADGKADLLVASLSSGTQTFAIFTSTGTFFTRVNIQVTTDPGWEGSQSAGNFAGNAAPDIVYQPRNFYKKVIYVNDGAGNFTRQDYDGKLFPDTDQRRVVADFDNDGKLDMVQATSGITNSRIMLRDVTSFTFLKHVCDRPGQTRIVDFDRSQTTDYSFWNPANGDWSHRTNASPSGPPPVTATVNWGLGSFGDIPAPGDFDGDGITDRAVFRDSTGVWYIRRSSDLSWIVFPFGLTGDEPVVGDYDGDTISDIAVWRPSDGNWHVWYMGPQQYTVGHFGSTGDKPVPADFDGDFKTDIAVYRPSTGAWYYLKSSDGNWAVVQWGISTDRPIPADFDGDGKADITVYRESDKFAYILRSTTGTPSYYQFGLAGDIAQIGDYDGDFVSDLGFYRPSTRAWWTTISLFSSGPTFGVDGGIPTSSILKGE